MITLEIAVGVAGALLLCFGLWFLWLRKYLEWQNLTTLDIKERVGLKIEFVKTAAQIVGGLFFILTILVAYRNYQVSQKNLELAKDKEVTELYVKAIGQLGSDKLPVVLGGIYALERIARDSQKDHGPIMEVLTALVRLHAPWTPEKAAEANEEPAISEKPSPEIKPRADIQAILTVLGRRTRTYGKGESQPLDLHRTDLRGADLTEAHLEGAHLWGTHLEGADLTDSHLKGAVLFGAHLEGAHLEGADLGGAYLMDSHLEWTNLNTASGLTQAQIDQTYCDEHTKLPPGLKRSERKEPSP